jgi:prepilin-type N-terminal cleavage/methylation domain-containing protein
MGRFSKTLAKMMRGKQKGFTLIELLIVVAILGILAAVIIPNVSSFMATGKLNAVRTEAENVKTAALAFYADWSVWPGDSDNLTGDNPSSTEYVTGTLKASYTFDTVTGLISDGTLAGFAWNDGTLTWDKAAAP